MPNTTALETGFDQFEIVAEGEERHSIFGEPGKLKILGFMNRGRMGAYADAIRLAQSTSATPDTARVRRYASRPGASINFEQQVGDGLGAFARVSINDGSKEAYEFTEINSSISAGLSLNGARWNRPNDTIGLAAVANAISKPARAYLAAGGMGILIGDGRLCHYGTEDILEAYYNAQLTEWLFAGTDYQLIANPAYNRDRGPVSILAVRLHTEF